jgi:hypothetical protein
MRSATDSWPFIVCSPTRALLSILPDPGADAAHRENPGHRCAGEEIDESEPRRRSADRRVCRVTVEPESAEALERSETVIATNIEAG